jgi:chromosome segregation ATPase
LSSSDKLIGDLREVIRYQRGKVQLAELESEQAKRELNHLTLRLDQLSRQLDEARALSANQRETIQQLTSGAQQHEDLLAKVRTSTLALLSHRSLAHLACGNKKLSLTWWYYVFAHIIVLKHWHGFVCFRPSYILCNCIG